MISTGDKSGFEVSIRRPGGEAFNEYDVKQTPGGNGQPSVTSCWLESEQDATFEIKCKIGLDAMVRNQPYDWTIDIYVDGRRVKYTAESFDDTKPSSIRASHMRFMENGVTYKGQLKFASLKTTDKDEEVTLSGSQLQSLGTIRIDFARGRKGMEYDTVGDFLVEPDVGVASEKGKKQVIYIIWTTEQQAYASRLGGGIGYADKQPTEPRKTSIKWNAHDAATLPYHRIEFNYRLRPILQLSGVIDDDIPPPRAPAHSAALPTVPLAGPSRKRKAEVIDIDDEEVDAKPEVKPKHKDRVTWLERQLQKANELLKRRRIIAPADVVDLTGDD